MSSFDYRQNAGEKVKSNEENPKYLAASRPPMKYTSTREGDVVVIEPSFDAEDNDGRGPGADTNVSGDGEKRTSPLKGTTDTPKRGHTRNLSEHFYDATTLSNDPALKNTLDSSGGCSSYASKAKVSSPAVGQKHRRVFSGDVSNPAEAHRRINSIGNSASVQRRPFMHERQHQRADSAGLDILTAAVDVSRDDLAAVVGDNFRGGRGSWDAPRSGGRRSSIEMISYDHSSGVASAPHPPSRGHPRGYPPGPPPPPFYGAHGYPQPPYPPPTFYPPTGPHNYQRTVPTLPSGGYPIQYTRSSDPYSKHPPQGPLHQPTLERPRDESQHLSLRQPAEKGSMTPPPPVAASHWRGGSTQGVQTYVTAIGVGDGSRTVKAAASQRNGVPSERTNFNHHRKTSSISSWTPSAAVFMGPPGELGEHPLKAHHRSTSSSVSFFGMEDSDATFLRNLQASSGSDAPQYSSSTSNLEQASASETGDRDAPLENDGSSKLAPGGTSKRVRRKCTVEGCQNRVVQGGLCISHGAKRKQCKYPGCTKNVKKAGLCSTHGPARKRCEAEGCTKVAVQGGRCIAHGAKKKLCSMNGCTKQAILAGMCKKHHDQSHKESISPPGDFPDQCKIIDSDPALEGIAKVPKQRKPTHTRGLSLFQEISPEAVQNLLSEDGSSTPSAGQTHRSTFSRDFGNLY